MTSSTPIRVQAVDREHAEETVALMRQMSVSLFGIHSPRLHRAIVGDALRGRVDCRLALDGNGDVLGIAFAARPWYWWTAPLTHWGVAYECVRARLERRGHARRASGRSGAGPTGGEPLPLADGEPPLTWRRPGRAWRMIFLGIVSRARGRGIGTTLFRAYMADRAFVGRISPDNRASIRMNVGVGIPLYRDGDVLQCVHLRPGLAISPTPRPAATLRADGPSGADCGRTSPAPRS
jgi:hypothetical protein